MASLAPFRALRPTSDHAAKVLAPPYDVINRDQARALAAMNPWSMVHVSRADHAFPDAVPGDSPPVHHAAAQALKALLAEGVLVLDEAPTYSVYRQTTINAGQTRTQTGVVACASVADYCDGIIAVHELTRPDKEADRVHHLDALQTHDEPVLLLARVEQMAPVQASLAPVVQQDPEVNVLDDMGVRHEIWVVSDPMQVEVMATALAAIDQLYIADGHHRSAAAARVAQAHPELPGVAVFPVVLCEADELTILAYHRLVADLGFNSDESHRNPADFLAELARVAEVVPVPAAVYPSHRHEWGLYCAGQWYRVTPHAVPATGPSAGDAADALRQLDVQLLHEVVLGPLLGITDPRNDPRLGFRGGLDAIESMQRDVDAGSYAAAWTLYPTSTNDLMSIADAGAIMPPKSTWFDPKLGSGLFLHPWAP